MRNFHYSCYGIEIHIGYGPGVLSIQCESHSTGRRYRGDYSANEMAMSPLLLADDQLMGELCEREPDIAQVEGSSIQVGWNVAVGSRSKLVSFTLIYVTDADTSETKQEADDLLRSISHRITALESVMDRMQMMLVTSMLTAHYPDLGCWHALLQEGFLPKGLLDYDSKQISHHQVEKIAKIMVDSVNRAVGPKYQEYGLTTADIFRLAKHMFPNEWVVVKNPGAPTAPTYHAITLALGDGTATPKLPTRLTLSHFIIVQAACNGDCPDMIDLLVDEGFDINSKDSNGLTPLDVLTLWSGRVTQSPYKERVPVVRDRLIVLLNAKKYKPK